MTFVFWQGIISIHQKSFLEAVAAQAAVTSVLLVVEQDITQLRKDMGWDVPDIANVTIIRNPSKQQIRELVHVHKEAVHIMGGIRVGPMLTRAFDRCVKEECKLGIMTEPYNDAGLKGKLRTLKYQYYRRRYLRYVHFVLAIGKQGVQQYAQLGFDTRRIFGWGYFISIQPAVRNAESPEIKRIMYAGRIEHAKGIRYFTELLTRTGSKHYTLDIYGTGPDEAPIREMIAAKKQEAQIHIHPFLKHDELVAQYGKYDWVVLPSVGKDGWGVIVSEGLLSGLKVICSNICGVSWTVKEGVNGLVFDWLREGSCEVAINRLLTVNTFAEPDEIKSLAGETISAAAGAAYLMEILNCVYDNKKKPAIPWE
jgi:glycosyltransferase involved in cell wall biosynthesis